MSYIDRGIIKWQPFDGLSGFTEMLESIRYHQGKQSKPLLLDDQLAEMDRHLKEAITFKKMIHITYYQDGNLYPYEGFIQQFDPYKHIITLSTHEKFLLDQIVDLYCI